MLKFYFPIFGLPVDVVLLLVIEFAQRYRACKIISSKLDELAGEQEIVLPNVGKRRGGGGGSEIPQLLHHIIRCGCDCLVNNIYFQ